MGDIWPQRMNFQEEVDAYKRRTGKRQIEIADDVGTTLGTFRNWLYNKDRRPSLESLQRAAHVFGCSITRFVDDPGAESAMGHAASEVDRFILATISADLGQMNDEQKQKALAFWKQAVSFLL